MQRHLLRKLCNLFVIHVLVLTESQMIQGNEAYMSTGSMGHNGNAFQALRSCHQVLHGDSGEFFSPDYLCSSPALWCNWTVQVHHGKRVQLYLEDLSPVHSCHLKTDQIHLDESPVSAGESRVLERCWGKARYKSVTNTVHVVQLIGPNPNPPHRGFYGKFRAFGPPETPATTSTVSGPGTEVVVSQDEEIEAEEGVTEVSRDESFTSKPSLSVGKVDGSLAKHVEVSQGVDSWPGELAAPTAGPWAKNSVEVRKTRGGAENQVTQSALHHNDLTFMESVSLATGTPGGMIADEYTTAPTYITHTIAMSTHNTHPITTSRSTTHTSTTEVHPALTRSPMSTTTYKKGVMHTADETYPAGAKMEEIDDALPVEMEEVPVEMMLDSTDVTIQTEHNESFRDTRPYSSIKPKPSYRLKGKALPVQTIRHLPEPPHLPGSLLLEVAVEIGLDHAHAESWDQIRSSFRGAIEITIQKELEKSNVRNVSLKRSKKLSAGALFIVWVQLGEGDDVSRTLGVLRSILQGLRGQSISPHDTRSRGIVISVSVEDINECETQLVMCDVHADCVNEFGSYSCHCHHGYSPGLGGAVCVEASDRDCIRTTVPMLLYVICFLLCFLVVLLLVVLLVLYRRYLRGAFLPRCHHVCRDRPPANDVNNNSRLRSERKCCVDPSSRPPPPPPPLRLSRSSCPASDLPLLKFSALAPPEGLEAKLQ